MFYHVFDGPVNPFKELSPTSFTISCSDIRSPQRKKKRVEHVLEELVKNIAAEKEEKREERKRRETKHEEIREENRRDRERRHKEQMDVQKSLVSILQQFLK
ncbi:PREDICTED: regulator of nonsense transcripts 3A-like [Trachymyrmex cornetzi]|uniref:regulator of nonsense transcripts 3A-like n=1 Tax=Trachymyrmex cornetzi TaxID=471704 RepID=UPI00084F6251|nr:PREDICTED: regulator of nonsense transcripts 3A-like [Trachymyrmex cornetzi]